MIFLCFAGCEAVYQWIGISHQGQKPVQELPFAMCSRTDWGVKVRENVFFVLPFSQSQSLLKCCATVSWVEWKAVVPADNKTCVLCKRPHHSLVWMFSPFGHLWKMSSLLHSCWFQGKDGWNIQFGLTLGISNQHIMSFIYLFNSFNM